MKEWKAAEQKESRKTLGVSFEIQYRVGGVGGREGEKNNGWAFMRTVNLSRQLSKPMVIYLIRLPTHTLLLPSWSSQSSAFYAHAQSSITKNSIGELYCNTIHFDKSESRLSLSAPKTTYFVLHLQQPFFVAFFIPYHTLPTCLFWGEGAVNLLKESKAARFFFPFHLLLCLPIFD